MSTPPLSGPPGHWLLGNLPAYNANPLGFVSAAGQYPGIVPLRMGPLRAVLLNDPQAIEAVLVDKNHSFHKARGVRRLRTLLGEGVLLTEGEFWLRERRLMQPAFHRASVARYADTMVARTTAMADRWSDTDVIDLVPEMRRLTLEIAAQSLFGTDLTDEEIRLVGDSLDTAGAQLQTRVSSLLMFVPDWLPTPGNRRMNSAIDRLDQVVYRIIQSRRKSTQKHDDLLSLLMAETDEHGTRMSDKQLRDEVITLLVAGHETTALTLTWALYLLARHPVADAKLAAELNGVLEIGRPPTPDDLPRLPYMAQIISEVLRLYPAGYITAREAIEDVEIGGHPIRKGAIVLMSQWARQRDAKAFPEPDAFTPERWIGGFERELRRGDYFPFGMGPRQCMGASFANLELALAVATLRRRFSFETTSSEEVKAVPIVALHPDRPIRLRLYAASDGRA
ncbi:MAG: cytochrome P450 [Chloroflexota bacterium]